MFEQRTTLSCDSVVNTGDPAQGSSCLVMFYIKKRNKLFLLSYLFWFKFLSMAESNGIVVVLFVMFSYFIR